MYMQCIVGLYMCICLRVYGIALFEWVLVNGQVSQIKTWNPHTYLRMVMGDTSRKN